MTPPRATGTIETHDWADGTTTSFYARIRDKGARHRIKLGTSREGWNLTRAKAWLDVEMDRVRRGTWQPPQPPARKAPHTPEPTETFHVTASRWWQATAPTVRPNTQAQYKWALDPLLREFAHTTTAEIDTGAVRRFRDHLITERRLAPRSINIILRILRTILEDATEDGLLERNPVTKRLRLNDAPGARSFLEADQVIDLFDAAGQLDREARATYRFGRRAMVATLALGGLRIAELCNAQTGHLDLPHHRLRVPDSKTVAGVREVELPLFLHDELAAYVSVSPRSPWLFPTHAGGRRDPNRFRDRILRSVVERAKENRKKRGVGPMPDHVTPHTLRRTYISLALAAGRNPAFVAAQAGHADPTLTLRIYAQVIDRKRQDTALIWDLMRYGGETGGHSIGPRTDPTARELNEWAERRGDQ